MVHIGGALQYFLDKLYGLGVPKQCPHLPFARSLAIAVAMLWCTQGLSWLARDAAGGASLPSQAEVVRKMEQTMTARRMIQGREGNPQS